MNEIELAGSTYAIGKLNAKQQFHVARRLGPALVALATGFTASAEDDSLLKFKPIAEALARMSDEDSEYILDTCLAVCSRKQEKGFAKVMANGQMMFADIDLAVMIQLTAAVVKENLENFMGALSAYV